MTSTALAKFEQPEKSLTDYLDGLRRRRLSIVVTSIAFMVVSLAIAYGLPPVYRSSATILIEQQEIPQDLVRTTVTSYANQRIQIISQRAMTRSNLTEIIKKYNLYPEDQRKEPMEVLVDRLRDDVGLEMVNADVIDPQSGRPTVATIAFKVSYESDSAVLAQKVTNELTSLYLNENLKTRVKMASETAEFLRDESAKLSSKIAVLDAKIAEFKEKNAATLPDLMSLNIQVVERTGREAEQVDRDLTDLKQRKLFLQSELNRLRHNADNGKTISPKTRLKELETVYISKAAVYGEKHPDVIQLKKKIAALKETIGDVSEKDRIKDELKSARSEIEEMEQKYSSEHPDIIRLQRNISMLEEALKNAPETTTSDDVQDEPDDPSYLQVKTQLESVNLNIESLQQKSLELGKKRSIYEDRLAKTPQVEREYRVLIRGYENAMAKYQELKAKQLEAQVAETLESERKGERFTLIEPPFEPVKPDKPNRLAILLAGAMLSLVAGIGVGVLREAMDKTIRGVKGVVIAVGMVPLATIPYMATHKEIRRNRLGRRLAAATVGVGIVSTLALVHNFYKPLDVIWFIGLRRFGLA